MTPAERLNNMSTSPTPRTPSGRGRAASDTRPRAPPFPPGPRAGSRTRSGSGLYVRRPRLQASAKAHRRQHCFFFQTFLSSKLGLNVTTPAAATRLTFEKAWTLSFGVVSLPEIDLSTRDTRGGRLTDRYDAGVELLPLEAAHDAADGCHTKRPRPMSRVFLGLRTGLIGIYPMATGLGRASALGVWPAERRRTWQSC